MDVAGKIRCGATHSAPTAWAASRDREAAGAASLEDRTRSRVGRRRDRDDFLCRGAIFTDLHADVGVEASMSRGRERSAVDDRVQRADRMSSVVIAVPGRLWPISARRPAVAETGTAKRPPTGEGRGELRPTTRHPSERRYRTSDISISPQRKRPQPGRRKKRSLTWAGFTRSAVDGRRSADWRDSRFSLAERKLGPGRASP
jgi:hypothetical protein